VDPFLRAANNASDALQLRHAPQRQCITSAR